MLLDLDIFVVFPFPLLRPRGFNQIDLDGAEPVFQSFYYVLGLEVLPCPLFFIFYFSQSVTSVLSGFQLHTGFKQAMA